MFQSSVRINVGPNLSLIPITSHISAFQSSVRINVGPNVYSFFLSNIASRLFQSSVRINVGPNFCCLFLS